MKIALLDAYLCTCYRIAPPSPRAVLEKETKRKQRKEKLPVRTIRHTRAAEQVTNVIQGGSGCGVVWW